MQTSRWLLPFTWGVDLVALDAVVRLAESAGATLVPVSLVCCPPKGARLEHIQQSKDFLEAVQCKAARYQVAVERYEVFTVDVFQSLKVLVQTMHCTGIVLVTTGEHTRFIQDEEVKHVLLTPPAALVLIRLPARSGSALTPRLGARLLSWLRDRRRPQDGASQGQHALVEEEPLWVRTEQHHVR